MRYSDSIAQCGITIYYYNYYDYTIVPAINAENAIAAVTISATAQCVSTKP